MARLYNWNGLPRNVKIIVGDKMELAGGKADNFMYRYLSFADIEAKTFDYDLGGAAERGKINPEDTNKEGNFFTLRKIMNGKQDLLWIHRIGQHGTEVPPCPTSPQPIVQPPNAGDTGTGNTDTGYIDQPFSDQDYKTVLKEQPTCMMTKMKSLMPMVLPPSKNFIGYLNGLTLHDKPDITVMKAPDDGYNWEAAQIGVTSDPFGDGKTENNQYTNTITTEKQRQLSQMITTYGYKTNWGCLTNNNSFMNSLDGKGICNRMYKLNLAHPKNGNGAFALALSLDQKAKIGKGLDYIHKSMGAMILIRLFGQETSSTTDGAASTSSFPNSDITMRYAPDSQLTVIMGKNVEQGGFSENGEDLVPPFCQRTSEGTWNANPIIFYPTYAGMVLTNSIMKNAKGGNDSILLAAEKRGNIKNDMEIMGWDNAPEIKQYMDTEDGDKMKWFPTLVQEAQNPLDIGVRIVPKEKYIIGDTMVVRFIKCLGNFGYCPIYFYRLMAFTLFFKGEYVDLDKITDVNITGDATRFNYYIYPFICENTTHPDEDDGASGWNAGTCHITSDKGAEPFVVSGFMDGTWHSKNGLVCYDKDLEEAIYRADFEYRSNSLQRYPIEIFGCAIVTRRKKKFQFDILNDNGTFQLSNGASIFDGKFTYLGSHRQGGKPSESNFGGALDLITNLSVQAGLDGCSGSMTLDAFPVIQGLDVLLQTQSIGEIDFNVGYAGDTGANEGGSGSEAHLYRGGRIFKGFAMELATNDSEGQYQITVNLEGSQRKLSDMKLACAPFWDGDRLEAICAYFEAYCKIKLMMFSKKTANLEDGQPVDSSTVNAHAGKWKSSDQKMVNRDPVKYTDFRVPRSVDWKAPAVDFENGKTCYDALKDLAKMTGCFFTVGLDGKGYFYELNHYGFPYYVHNCMRQNRVLYLEPSDIISINLSPFINNKHNTIFTFGFLQKKKPDGMPDDNILQAAVTPGVFQTIITKSEEALQGRVVFPWSKTIICSENGYLTPSELFSIHKINVIASAADVYQGSVTVPGNTYIQHLYQVVNILEQNFFVVSIDHQIDSQTKSWTTSYQLNYYDYKILNEAAANDPDKFDW